MEMKENRMHVLSHTHWDREWYQSFQYYRMRLVFQMDELLDILENDPDYRCFHLDGQTCCVEDYLAIRPENRARLQIQLSAGRIEIGPWYVMPDEFLLSGESLIRNLRLGFKICKDFAVPPTPVGYVTDIFGHISQFPQIMKGFGLETVLLHRGAPSSNDESSELVWEGADGSRVLVVKAYRDTGYNDFLSIHLYNRGNDEYIRQYEENKLSYAKTSVLFSLDGNDHTPAFRDTKKVIAECNDVFKQTTCFHSSMTDFIADLKRELHLVNSVSLRASDCNLPRPDNSDPLRVDDCKAPRLDDSFSLRMDDCKVPLLNKSTDLPVIRGELRVPPMKGVWNEIFYGTGSSRHDLKQNNDHCEYLLTRIAEPLNAWAKLHGGDDNTAFLSLSWNYLLKNHPHDSIVGCSMDQVHRDMMYRFDQCRLIASACMEESIRTISQSIPVENDCISITVFNMSIARQNSGEILLEVPLGRGVDFEDPKKFPVLIAFDGMEYPARVSRVKKSAHSPYFMHKTETCESKLYQIDFSRCSGTDQVYLDCSFDIPPLSYSTFHVELRDMFVNETAGYTWNTSSEREWIENEFLRVSANPDGTLDLFNKATLESYNGIGYLEDCGDKGEGWSHFHPGSDKVILSRNTLKDIDIHYTHDSFLSKIEISYAFDVPKSLVTERTARSTELSTLQVQATYSLRKGKKYLECHMEIDNTAIEHRVRMLSPTGTVTDTYIADTAFDTVVRKIPLRNTEGWVETEREDHPFKNFISISDEKRSLAIITKGICEGCVVDDGERTLGITLYRSFVETLFAESTSDSKHLGKVQFDFAFAVPSDTRDLWMCMEDYKLPVITFTHMDNGRIGSHSFPKVESLIEIGDLQLSAITLDKNDIEMRVYNPSNYSVKVEIKPSFSYQSMNATLLSGETIVEIPDNLDAGKILNLRFIDVK